MTVTRSSIGGGGAAATVREASFGDPTSVDAWPARARLCLLGIVGGTALAIDLPSSERAAGARCTVGRSAEADAAIAHPTISRVHAAFFVSGDARGVARCQVEDLGSLNGTRVAGSSAPRRRRAVRLSRSRSTSSSASESSKPSMRAAETRAALPRCSA